MPKPILFCDFDGTICFERYWRSLPTNESEQVQNLLFREDRTLMNDWMRGKYTAEEINIWLSEQTGIPYENLWRIFVEDCKTMQVSQSTLEKLNSVRNRYTTILITGNMDSFSRFTVPELRLEKYFDHISNSYYEGQHKVDNSGQLFKQHADKYGVSLTDCILLDDNEQVCTIFEKLGGKACRVTTEQTVDHYLSKL